VWDAEEEYGNAEEVLEGAGRAYVMSTALRDLAHQYALKNMAIMQPWLTYVLLKLTAGQQYIRVGGQGLTVDPE
jgi:hypothetical protein